MPARGKGGSIHMHNDTFIMCIGQWFMCCVKLSHRCDVVAKRKVPKTNCLFVCYR